MDNIGQVYSLVDLTSYYIANVSPFGQDYSGRPGTWLYSQCVGQKKGRAILAPPDLLDLPLCPVAS